MLLAGGTVWHRAPCPSSAVRTSAPGLQHKAFSAPDFPDDRVGSPRAWHVHGKFSSTSLFCLRVTVPSLLGKEADWADCPHQALSTSTAQSPYLLRERTQHESGTHLHSGPPHQAPTSLLLAFAECWHCPQQPGLGLGPQGCLSYSCRELSSL